MRDLRKMINKIELKNDLYIFLKLNHLGKSASIPSRDLESKYNLTGAEIRSLIKEMRQEGHLIGSWGNSKDHEGGYFVITTVREYLETKNHLQHRALSMLQTIKMMDVEAKKSFGSIGAERQPEFNFA